MVCSLLDFSLCLALLCVLGAQASGGDIADFCASPWEYYDDELRLNETQYVPAGTHCRGEGIWNLTITGTPDLITIYCEKDEGNITSSIFSFINVSFLTIENVHFVGCGASLDPEEDLRFLDEDSKSYFGPGQPTVLLCNHCEDLSLRNVKFSNNTGYSFVGINLHGNRSELDKVEVFGGDDEEYLADDPRCNETGKDFLCHNRGVFLFFANSELKPLSSSVTVKDSVFVRNNGMQEDSSSTAWCIRNVFGEFVIPKDFQVLNFLPDVGALSMIYTQNFTANVSVLNSNFTENHGLCFGGIFSLLLTPSPLEVHQLIDGCHFTDNSPIVMPSGEGKNYLGRDITVYMKFDGEYGENKSISIVNCTLESRDQDIMRPSISIIHFPDAIEKCMIYLENVVSNTIVKMLFISGLTNSDSTDVVLKDVRMMSDYRYNKTLRGLDQNDGLLMFINLHSATIKGTSQERCQFNHLLGPVILARSTALHLTGEMLIANNYASAWANGAGILLQSAAQLWLQEPLHAHFCNNTAVSGGAISSSQLVDEFCIIQYSTESRYDRNNISSIDIRLNFTTNSATVAGNSIYMESLYNCSTRLSSLIPPLYPIEVYNVVFHYEHNVSNGLREISSQPKEICACDNGCGSLNCAKESLNNISTIMTYPGKDFTLTIASVDEMQNLVYTNMYNNLHPRTEESLYADTTDFHWTLGPGQDLVKVYGTECSQLTFTIINNVSEYSIGTLALYPFGEVDCLAIPVVLEKCPPGFRLSTTTGKCVCSGLLAKRNFTCDIKIENITRQSTAEWIGVINSKNSTWGNDSEVYLTSFILGYSSTCHYVLCNKETIIHFDYRNMTGSEICSNGHTGILCGQCPDGMSSVIGGHECRECSNWWLFTLFIYILLGPLLVFILFLLRLTVASGTINGLILFANLFQINTYYFFDFKTTKWLWVFISALNLKLGFPLCFFDGMTSLVSTYLSFLVPVYLWLIILVITMLSQRNRTMAALTSRSVIPVLATIVYLSFSKVLDLVVHGFSFSTLYMETQDGHQSHKFVWFYDGSVDFLKGKHLGLFFLSLISLLFYLLPYTVFFTGVKFFSRFSITERVRPFVDAFCAPYKPKWRFMFGLRLCLLVVVYILYVVLRFKPNISILVETVLLLLFTVLHVAIMPYKNVLLNYLDTFFLVDSLLLNIVALQGQHLETASNLLMIPVFLAFCAIMAYHIYLLIGQERIQKILLLRKVASMMKKHTMGEEGEGSSGDDDEHSKSEGRDSDKPPSERSSLSSKGHHATYSTIAINDEAGTLLQYKPGELREPLLESDSENA